MAIQRNHDPLKEHFRSLKTLSNPKTLNGTSYNIKGDTSLDVEKKRHTLGLFGVLKTTQTVGRSGD